MLALSLAVVGILLVISYANRADERALGDQETVDVLMATEAIPQGTPADEMGETVEVRQIPRAYVVEDAVAAVEDLEDRVAQREIRLDEQISNGLFVPADELRRQGVFVLPEEAESLHQLTINIPNPRALGGSIAAGDLVGVFSTFEVEPPSGWTVDESGALIWDDDQASNPNDTNTDGDETQQGSTTSDDTITYTDLLLDKVLVVRVEGGFVAAQEEDQDAGAADSVHVTLAVQPQEAARIIFAMETGSLWLTFAPEDADGAEVDAVVPALPTQVIGVIE
ncbi:Flp pilus assembly protein CpaB [Ornithinimicrobium sp. W1665]